MVTKQKNLAWSHSVGLSLSPFGVAGEREGGRDVGDEWEGAGAVERPLHCSHSRKDMDARGQARKQAAQHGYRGCDLIEEFREMQPLDMPGRHSLSQ